MKSPNRKQLDLLSKIRKPTLPAPRQHKDKTEYVRRSKFGIDGADIIR